MSITPPRPQHGEPVHPAKIHADYLGRPIAAGDWVSIDEAAPVLVLDLYREGQFVYGAPDGQLVTYFCCCVKKVCPSPAHQRPGDSLAAPAEAGHGVCTVHPEKTRLDKYPDNRFVLAKGAGPGIWNRWQTHVGGYRVFWSHVNRGYLA